jgi:hypothetical protein
MTYGPSGPDLSKGTPRKAGPPGAAGGVFVPAHPAGAGRAATAPGGGPRCPRRRPGGGLKTAWRQPVGGGYGDVAASRGRVYTQDYRPAPPPSGARPRPRRAGRLCGQERSEDVLSFVAQRRHGFRVERLPASTRSPHEHLYADPHG